MSRFRLGDRIRIVEVTPLGLELSAREARLIGAEAVIIERDPRPHYSDYWEAWPDDEELCNPGRSYRAWCIHDEEKGIELVSRASVDELLTSERRSWRDLGRSLLKKNKRFSLIKR